MATKRARREKPPDRPEITRRGRALLPEPDAKKELRRAANSISSVQMRPPSSVPIQFLMRLAFLALIVRALIPAGWMVAADPETGRPSLQLCTGTISVRAAMTGDTAPSADMHAHHEGGHHRTEHQPVDQTELPAEHGDHTYAETPCPIAFASVIGPASLIPDLPQPTLQPAPDRAVPPVRGPPTRRWLFAPLPPRGPPTFA